MQYQRLAVEPGAPAAMCLGSGGLVVMRPLRPQKAVGQHFSVGRSVLDRQEIGWRGQEGAKPMRTVAGASGRREAASATKATSAQEATSAEGVVGRRPTIYDVARAAGVATSTVSRALSNPGRVSFKTAEHFRRVAKELGYRSELFEREVPDQRTKISAQ